MANFKKVPIHKHLINFYLYSSLHISLCAAALTLFTYMSYHIEVDFAYVFFVGFSTMLTYGLHRVVGIKKMDTFSNVGRFGIVKQFKSHIVGYTIIAGLLCLSLFFILSSLQQVAIIVAGAISLSYTLPIFSKGKRLRDFAFIKIFLIAIVWALVSETIVLLETDSTIGFMILPFIERVLFFIAITIPFDIRDQKVDKTSGVTTLATSLGVESARNLAYVLLLFAAITCLSNSIDINSAISKIICYVMASCLIYKSKEHSSDIWFSGFLDGTMMIPLAVYTILSL